MNILLDTHVLLWWLADDQALPESFRTAIEDPTNVVYVSAASAWEISIKKALGKLAAPDDLPEVLDEFEHLPITVAHASAVASMAPHHRDPFDRMLIAQALAEELTIATVDPAFEPYPVPRL